MTVVILFIQSIFYGIMEEAYTVWKIYVAVEGGYWTLLGLVEQLYLHILESINLACFN